MKHRMGIGAVTGFGGNAPVEIPNSSTGNNNRDLLARACAEDCYKTFFKNTKKDYGGVDGGFTGDSFKFGIEATYQFDEIKIIEINEDKQLSNIKTGKSFGAWGTAVRSDINMYKDYKYATKFTRFIDKWYTLLYESKEKA